MPAAAFSPQRLGPFEVIRMLGRSMTDVYLAHDERHHRRIVLKLIRDAGDTGTRQLIEAESRGAAIQKELRRRDRRILQVYEWGVADGWFYVALEYFPGTTLADLLRAEGRLAPRRAARYAAEICNQLRSLHGTPAGRASGQIATIHGDIKPSNIQIGARDELRLLDFGIAKFIRPGHDLTHHQMGSPSYCSPERLRQAQVDYQADLWALGVTLFEMLAGAPPFQASSTHELERLIGSGRPPRIGLPQDCPDALRGVVDKALASDAAQRYGSAALFEADLRAFLQATVETAPEPAEPVCQAADIPAPAPVFVPVPVFAPASVSVETKPARARRSQRGSTALALLAGLLAGLFLFLPTVAALHLRSLGADLSRPKNYALLPPGVLAADWQNWQTLRHGGSWSRAFLDKERTTEAFRGNLTASAASLLRRLSQSAPDRMNSAAWERLRLCLLYALEIGPDDRRARGELQLADASIQAAGESSPSDASLLLAKFRRAARLLPASALPHLGLARVYAYGLHNASAVQYELRQAERQGLRLGPREREEQADVYLYAGELALGRVRQQSGSTNVDAQKYLHSAALDLERARSLYEPLAGEAGVPAKLTRIVDDQDAELQLAAADAPPPPAPARNLRNVAATSSKRAFRPKHRVVLLKIRWSHVGNAVFSAAVTRPWQ